MWKEAWKIWFPIGKSDPNIALLKFTAHEGEYWDNAGMQGLKYVYDAAKAYVTGERHKPTTHSMQKSAYSRGVLAAICCPNTIQLVSAHPGCRNFTIVVNQL